MDEGLGTLLSSKINHWTALVGLRLSGREALLILSLLLADFAASVFLTEGLRPRARFGFRGRYLVLAALRLAASRRDIPRPFRDGVFAPPKQLAEDTT